MDVFDSDSDSDIEVLDIRRRKTYLPRINMGLDDFRERFRLTRGQCDTILTTIGPLLQHSSGKSSALTPNEQLLITLRFLATGAFYNVIGDSHGIAKMSVCRSIKRCVNAINSTMFRQHIDFPSDASIASRFFEFAGMPSVVGCIDGTHIKIEAPTENEPHYVNRHGDHSINAMCVCGPDRTFYYICARWPGSVGDARVLRNSGLLSKFENGWRPFPNAVILGDSAYPLKDWLIPPILNTRSSAEERFNRAHKRTRRIIENAR